MQHSIAPSAAAGVATAQCGHLISVIQSVQATTHADAADALALIMAPESGFDVDQKNRLASAIDTKLMGVQGKVVSESKTQTHVHLEHYYTATLWTRHYSHCDVVSLLESIAEFLVGTLGIRTHDEMVRRDAVAIATTARGMDLTPDEAYNYVEKMRQMMEIAMDTIDGFRGPMSYPADPQSFIAAYPNAYAPDNGPVASKLEHRALLFRKRQTPCRSNHGLLMQNQSSRRKTGKQLPGLKSEQSASEVVYKYILGHMSASSANALPSNVTDMFRKAEGSQTAAVKPELAGSPHAAVKDEPAGSPPASPTASAAAVAAPHDLVGAAPRDLVGDLEKLRAETVAKFKTSGIDITGGDGGDVGSVKKRPSSVMKRPSTAPTETDVKKRPAAGGTWNYELRTTPTGRNYPVYIAPNGVRFKSKLAAMRAKPTGYTE